MAESAPEAATPEAVLPRVSLRQALWPTLLSLAVVAGVGYFTFDLAQFRAAFARLDLPLLAAAIASVVARVLLGGWRLHYVSHRKLGLAAGVRAQLAWDFFSNVSPSAIGGGPLAAVYMARDRRIGLGEATAYMLVAMLMDKLLFAFLVPSILVAASFFPVFPAYLGRVATGTFVAVFAAILVWEACFAYATLYRPDLLRALVHRMAGVKWLRHLRPRIDDAAAQLERQALILRAQAPGFYLKGMGITLLTWAAKLSLPLLVVLSVYPQADQVLVGLRTIVMSLGGLVLPTPGGSGGAEGLYALLIGPLMPPSLVAPTLLAWRFLSYYVFILAGMALSMHHLHDTLQRRRSKRPSADPSGYGALQPLDNALHAPEL